VEIIEMKRTIFIIATLLLAVVINPLAAKTYFVKNPTTGPGYKQIFIDHNCVDLSIIPDSYLPLAASLRVLFRHASVGQGIDWGLDCLAGEHPTNSSCSCYLPGKYDCSNWVFELRAGDWQEKVDDLVIQTETRADNFDVFTMKFCYIDALGDSHPDWDYCRTTMEQIENDYPNKKFVWWTIPLTRDGQSGTDWFNQMVRSYCAANNKILFDIADIECYDPNGVKHTNAQGYEVICQDYTKEIHAGHLNVPGRIRVASAFWRLMARLAGWQRGPIQRAIDAASDGDTIVVEKGIYFENINFRGKNIILTSANPDDPSVVAATIIDGNNLESVVTFAGTENKTCVFSGFTIQNGYHDNEYTRGGGGISGGTEINHTYATIRNNIITHNFAWDGGGLSCCDGLIEKNIITANTARWWQGGGGLYQCNGFIRNNIISFNNAGGCESAGALSYCDATIENNTITQNFSQGVGVVAYGHGTIQNCIVWGNFRQEIWNSMPSFSCIQDWTGGGQGNIDTDPCFVNPGHWEDPCNTPYNHWDDVWIDGDYHLKSQAGRWDADEGRWTKDDETSPCIDAGDLVSPIGFEPFPNGGIINMGAYGGTGEASKSYFGEPVCETIVAGDINGDCIVNLKDFALLALHWLEEH
jgi:hypothetical protein